MLSPIDGIIGRSSVTEGALVTANQAAALAAVQQIDPMYVDVTQSSVQLLRLQEALASGQLTRADGEQSAVVTLTLEDGTQYKQQGKLQFSEVTVDPGTGSVTLRAVFPNPDRRLLPGMFVRARLVDGVASQGLLVPQRGVTRNQRGEPTAMVVNAENKVELRTLKTDRAVGDQWLVSSGLAAGDKVIVEGLQMVRPGVEVVATEAGAKPQTAQQPPAPPTRRSSKSGATHGKVFYRQAGIRLGDRDRADDGRRAFHPEAAGLAVPQHRAAGHRHRGDLSRCLGADGAGHRGAGDRAADERPGRAGVHLVGKQPDGSMSITLTFRQGTNPDTAQVQVQNKLSLAQPLLPQEVQQQGIRVTKATKNFLIVAGFVSTDGTMTKDDLADYVASYVQIRSAARRASVTSSCSARSTRCASG